ncbi:glycosyltransferase family 4 protein [Thermococcus barophilus]|uniref:Glycosyl transferase n=1 Tax=Thermococcus barophilus (strain DSM 11836 / MP) TaxID=391623 RepID=F0LLW9_THEBM|nr:glycosyltransferase family 4 protein [Thermococcus barophilus]ADT85068.1 glycosyl transferase [Thermococcus barophilus MP]
MKVLLIVRNVLHPHDGPSSASYNTIKGLKTFQKVLEKNEISIDILSLDTTDNRSVDVSELESPNLNIINVKSIPLEAVFGEIYCVKMYSNKLHNTHNLVHSHVPFGAFFGIFNRLPTLLTVHGMVWKERKHITNKYAKVAYGYGNTFRIRKYADKVSKLIALSPYAKEEFISLGVDPDKIAIIENPISEEFFKVKKNEENIILYPANIIPLKNQLGFLRAVKLVENEVRDFKIIFAGSGDSNYIRILKDFVRRNEIRNVKFLGRVRYKQMLTLYSNASITVLLSFQETLPMVILEAMATGTPTLVSKILPNRYIVTPNKTGVLADPNNPENIAEKLRILIDDKKLRQKLGKNAKKEAEKRWKSKVIARKLLDLYLTFT